jgi:anti-sigma-K factor RskA
MNGRDHNSDIEKVRAYVQGKLGADERHAFEEQMKRDASLQSLVSMETQRIKLQSGKNGWACVHGETPADKQQDPEIRASLDGSIQSLVNADTQRVSLPDNGPDTGRVWAYVHGKMSAEERSEFETRMRSDTRIQSLVNAETQRVKTESNPDNQRVWAYVHGGMGANERREFEARLSRDTTLQSLVNAETQRVNMQNTHPDAERAWTYVHGEMDQDERRAFEVRMEREPALRAVVKEIRTTDQELKKLAPYATLDDKGLAEKLLAEWEASQAGDDEPDKLFSRRQSVTVRARSQRPRFRFSKPVRLTLAAAAFCAVVAVGIYNTQTPPIIWEIEIVQQATYRGASGEEALPRYTRSDMTELTSSLRASVEDEFRYMATKDKKTWPGWVLSTRIQELEAGRLAVQVQAYKSKGEKPVKEWLKNYADAQAFRSRVDDYGRQIVEDLAQLGHGSQDYIE